MAHPAEPFAGDLYPQRAGAGGPPQSHWLIQPQLPLCHFHMVPSSVDRNCCKPSRAMAEWPWRWGQRSVHTPGTARSLILQAVATATHPACPQGEHGARQGQVCSYRCIYLPPLPPPLPGAARTRDLQKDGVTPQSPQWGRGTEELLIFKILQLATWGPSSPSLTTRNSFNCKGNSCL